MSEKPYHNNVMFSFFDGLIPEDRTENGGKLPMEDMCQLAGKLTEQKYQGSYEMITKLIKKYSSSPMLDVVNFWGMY